MRPVRENEAGRRASGCVVWRRAPRAPSLCRIVVLPFMSRCGLSMPKIMATCATPRNRPTNAACSQMFLSSTQLRASRPISSRAIPNSGKADWWPAASCSGSSGLASTNAPPRAVCRRALAPARARSFSREEYDADVKTVCRKALRHHSPDHVVTARLPIRGPSARDERPRRRSLDQQQPCRPPWAPWLDGAPPSTSWGVAPTTGDSPPASGPRGPVPSDTVRT